MKCGWGGAFGCCEIMRRPNICNNTVGTVDDAYKPHNLPPPKDEGRLSLVRRVLGGSRKIDGHSSSHGNRQFGVTLTELQVKNNSVPKVLHRLCVYLELNGMKIEGLFKLSAGNSSTVETLKNQFNANGDAELELANDVNSVALLLIVWLKDLPEPLLTQETVAELISLMHKYDGDSWWGPVCYESILTSGQLSSNVMSTVLRLLHCYTAKYPSSMTYIPNVFCPLLTCEEVKDISSVDAIELTSKLIRDYSLIFKKRNLEADCLNNSSNTATIVVPERKSSLKQRKRKEKIDCILKSERKFVRSNSEERPALNSTCGGMRADTMRRVSSHEDFSKSHPNGIPKCEIQLKKITQPLHERNTCSPQRSRRLPTGGLLDAGPEPSPETVGYASDLYDENEHERRRNNERFAPQPQSGRRTVARRRRTKHRFSYSQAKENENNLEVTPHSDVKRESETSNSSGAEMKVGALPIPLNLDLEHRVQDETSDVETNQAQYVAADDDEIVTEEEDDRSPSPISGVDSPILDLNTFQGEIKDDPVPSLPWSSVHSVRSDERLVSPHNSMFASHRAFSAIYRPFDDEPSLLDLGTQINNLKRKLKKYDEGFEREFGYRPSHADKLANPDTKKMSSMLSNLKKQLRTTKEECMKLAKCEKKELREEIVIEVEKRLAEKRVHAGRPESLDAMTHEQLVDEKTAIQKVLLQIEASFGRPTSNEDKILVRGLYERYRTVKRIILRYAPSKFKESVTELGTILEHEAMDFTASPPSTPPRMFSPQTSTVDSSSGGDSTATAAMTFQSSYQPKVSDIPLDNLHALPRNELIILQKSTRDEKRRLRRILKDREMDFQIKTGRRLQKEDRPSSFDSIYVDYKHAKAKLKFIDALMLKKK